MNIVTIQNLKNITEKGKVRSKPWTASTFPLKREIHRHHRRLRFGKNHPVKHDRRAGQARRGEVIVDGVRLSGMKEKELAVFRRSKVGFVYQNFNLVPTLTVRENILFPLSLSGNTPDMAFFQEITQTLGLSERLDAFPEQLSGGGQQRAAIARALIMRPALILADEPTGNLDSRNGQNVLGLLKLSVETWHQTLIMITHNLELAQMADRVVRIEDGRILG